MRRRQLSSGRGYGRAKLTASAAALAAVGVLGSGCAVPTFSTESRTTRELPPPPEYTPNPNPNPTPARSLPSYRRTVTGSWRGTYVCNQGLTNMTLTLAQRPNSVLVTGIFRFEGRASGSYTVRGTATSSTLSLRGDNWLRRPSGYEMVSLRAPLSSVNPDEIRGTVTGVGCSTFSVRRS